MHRDSDRHGPAMDDQLSRESEGIVRGTGSTHAQEWKETEPTGDIPVRTREPGSPPGMSQRDVDARSELAKALAPARFPVAAAKVVALVEHAGVSDAMIDAVRELPADGAYADVTDVVRALGIRTEEHRT